MKRPTPTRLAVLLVLLAAPAARAADDPDAPDGIKKAAKSANDHRAAIQKTLSESAPAKVGRSVRVDGFDAKKNGVEARGFYLEPFRAADERKADGPEAAKLKDNVRLELLAAVQASVPNAKRDEFGINMTAVRLEDQPHLVLQGKAAAAGGEADELVLTSSGFDKDGRLVVAGRVAEGKAAPLRAWLDAGAKELAKDAKFAWVSSHDRLVVSVTPVPWTLTPAALQAALAAPAATAEYRGRVRVDRVYPKYDAGNGQTNLELTGLWLDGGNAQKTQDAVKAAATAEWNKLEVGLKAFVQSDAFFDPATRINDPFAAFQKAVAVDARLDGTRVAPGLLFSDTGKVALAGVRPTFDNPDQAQAWKSALEQQLKVVAGKEAAAAAERGAGLAKLLDRGVETRELAPLPSRQILAQLRALAAREEEFLEDVLLRRLAFDADGRLKLDGHFVRDIDRDRVADALRRAVAEHLAVAAPTPPATDPKPKEGSAAPPAVAAPPTVTLAGEGLQKIPGVTEHLRSVLRADRKAWYGVVIGRGYFEPDGKYTVTGVVDQTEQKVDFDKLVAATRADDRWKDALAVEPKANLELFTMKRLLDRVKRVAPAYPACDGVAFEGVGYDAKDNLVFDVTVIGSGRTSSAQKLLRSLLAVSPDYGRRLPRSAVPAPGEPGGRRIVTQGVVFNQTNLAVPPSPTIGNYTGPIVGELVGRFVVPPPITGKSFEEEAASRARLLLDTGLLHTPDESGLWYLSAYLHLQAGDRELARRDLCRVIGIEEPTGYETEAVFRRRYDIASRIQGPTRSALDELLAQCRRELRNGGRPISLDSVPTP